MWFRVLQSWQGRPPRFASTSDNPELQTAPSPSEAGRSPPESPTRLDRPGSQGLPALAGLVAKLPRRPGGEPRGKRQPLGPALLSRVWCSPLLAVLSLHWAAPRRVHCNRRTRRKSSREQGPSLQSTGGSTWDSCAEGSFKSWVPL